MLDLIIAGAGPAGLATALFAAQAGLDAVVLDPRAQPVDKACGEGLLPPAVAALAGLGVALRGSPIVGIRYTDGARSAQARFRSGIGLGVRRTELSAAMVGALRTTGTGIEQCRIGAVEQHDGAVTAGGFRARYLVAADGLHSPIRRSLGLQGRPRIRPRYGLRAHFRVPPWTDHVEVHWSADSEAYVTPVAADLVGVATLSVRREPYQAQLARFPALAGLLPTPVTRALGAGPLRQHATRRTCGRVLLVGDAAGYTDACTGEGISVAIATASAAVTSIVRDEVAAYDGRWRVVSRRYRWATAALMRAGSVPAIRRRIVPAAAATPLVFRAAVQVLGR